VELELAAVLPDVTAVTAGLSHTCAVNTAGAVLCWGDNAFAQLGSGGQAAGISNPFPRIVPGLDAGVAAVAAGDYHTCALTSGGSVLCWGANFYGQLGIGATLAQTTPVTVTGLISGVAAISAGGNHTCAITAEGGVTCWGDQAPTPTAVPGLGGRAMAVAAGYMHTCAAVVPEAADDEEDGGTVRCWGANDTGQLGNGATSPSTTPVEVPGLAGVTALAAGGAPLDRFTSGGHTCALTVGGGVQCWGWNGTGQLGDTSTNNRLAPVPVTGLASGAKALDAGDQHTCALTGDVGGGLGAIKCWGDNRYGQLGVGSTEPYTTPVQVGGFTSGVVALAAGSAHTCAATEAGGLKCWGRNASGQLGNFTIGSQSLLPVNVIVPLGITYLPQITREP
jgi:alpha-tubulin suppressor-like RCC1 family protein